MFFPISWLVRPHVSTVFILLLLCSCVLVCSLCSGFVFLSLSGLSPAFVFLFSFFFPFPSGLLSTFDFCILDFGFQLYLIYLVIPPTCLCLCVYVTFKPVLLPPSSLINSKFEHDGCLVNARIIMFGRPLRNAPLLAGFGPFFGLLSLDLVFKIWLSV